MRTALPILLLALLLTGCGDPLSNRIFEEDLLFWGAVPNSEQVRTEAPGQGDGSEAREVGDEAQIPPLTRGIVTGANSTVFELLDVVEFVASQPVSSREQDRRIWGPYWLDADLEQGAVRMIVRRQGDGLFRYALEVREAGPYEEDVDEELWDEVMGGTFDRSGALRNGTGAFRFDGSKLDQYDPSLGIQGIMNVEHSKLGGELEVRIRFEGWGWGNELPADSEYYYKRPGGGGGILEYRSAVDWVDSGPALEDSAFRVRWLPGLTGRADGVLSGGDLGEDVIHYSECWGSDLLRTYFELDFENFDAGDSSEGDEADCVFAREEPFEIVAP